MSDAPEKIWAEPYAGTKDTGRWTAKPRFPHLPTKYVRADLYEKVKIELKALQTEQED